MIHNVVSRTKAKTSIQAVIRDALERFEGDISPYHLPSRTTFLPLMHIYDSYLYGLDTLHVTGEASCSQRLVDNQTMTFITAPLGMGTLEAFSTVKLNLLVVKPVVDVHTNIGYVQAKLSLRSYDQRMKLMGLTVEKITGIKVLLDTPDSISEYIVNYAVKRLTSFFSRTTRVIVEQLFHRRLTDAISSLNSHQINAIQSTFCR